MPLICSTVQRSACPRMTTVTFAVDCCIWPAGTIPGILYAKVVGTVPRVNADHIALSTVEHFWRAAGGPPPPSTCGQMRAIAGRARRHFFPQSL